MACIPCITSFITCEPASNVPVHPSAAIFHASGPRFTKNSDTIPWLPGGKNCVTSIIRSNRLFPPPIRLVASATAINNAGKNARKRLKAIACETTPHRGNTRANIPYARRRKPAAEIIAGHYTCLSHLVSEVTETHSETLRNLVANSGASRLFFHVDYGERFAVDQGDGDGFYRGIALYGEKLCASQRRTHLIPSKPSGSRRIFASLQDHAADSSARPIGMDEESANFCRIAKGIQQSILASRPVIAAVKGLALAPAAATNDHACGLRVFCASAFECAGLGLRHNVRSVGDELAIDAKDGFERAFHLRWSVVLRLQSAHGRFDQCSQNRNIFGESEAEVNVCSRHHSNAGPTRWILSPRYGGTRQNSNSPASWAGRVGPFEFVPVRRSKEALEIIAPRL